MPTQRIDPDPSQWDQRFKREHCPDPEHYPPMHMYYEPGEYEHECPTCRHIIRFTVPAITYHT